MSDQTEKTISSPKIFHQLISGLLVGFIVLLVNSLALHAILYLQDSIGSFWAFSLLLAVNLVLGIDFGKRSNPAFITASVVILLIVGVTTDWLLACFVMTAFGAGCMLRLAFIKASQKRGGCRP
jgi:Kef-type K+ transport system membrane component KefB